MPVEALLRTDLSTEVPALIEGLTVLESLWSPAEVVEAVGDVQVPIRHVTRGDYMNARMADRTVSDYFTDAMTDGPRDEIPYLAELSYDEHFPELAAQLIDPPDLIGEKFGARVMYFGRGTNSQIHHHISGSAILFGIHGTKLVRLFAPDQTPKLYRSPGRNFSQVLVDSVGENSYHHDSEAFPDFSDASYVDYEISAGQALFIPIWWWHSIQNLNDFSLTAVYFYDLTWHNTWRDFAPKQLPPKHMRFGYVTEVAKRRLIRPLLARFRR